MFGVIASHTDETAEIALDDGNTVTIILGDYDPMHGCVSGVVAETGEAVRIHDADYRSN